MSTLYFRSDFQPDELRSHDIPVEIRRADATLVKKSLFTKPIEIGPGSYFVTAKLPAGQQLIGQVEVGLDRESNVMLTLDPEDRAPPRIEILGLRSRGAKLRAFRGNFLREDGYTEFHLNAHVQRDSDESSLSLTIEGTDTVQILQLLRPRQSPLNIALPTSRESSCSVVLTARPGIQVDVHMTHKVADLLLQYRQNGNLEQATDICYSDAFNAEHLLYKVGNPIAAAVWAYALLKLGNIQQLHGWTEDLKDGFSWLPDGVTIRAEHLARLGKHEEALKVFLELPRRGLPLFGDGLSYAIDRVRLYTSGRGITPEAKSLLERLQRFAACVDFSKLLLTFTGIDPGHPDDKRLDKRLADFPGLDLEF